MAVISSFKFKFSPLYPGDACKSSKIVKGVINWGHYIAHEKMRGENKSYPSSPVMFLENKDFNILKNIYLEFIVMSMNILFFL